MRIKKFHEFEKYNFFMIFKKKLLQLNPIRKECAIVESKTQKNPRAWFDLLRWFAKFQRKLLTLSQPCPDLVTSEANFMKINENSIFILHFAWMFFWNRKNIVSRRITKSWKFQTFPEKIEIKVQPIEQFIWIKFRGIILMVRSSLQSFSFVCLSSCSQSAGKIFLLEPHSEATRKFPGSKKQFRGPNLTTFICVPKWMKFPKYVP